MGEALVLAAELASEQFSPKGCVLAFGLIGIVLAVAVIRHERNNRGQ